MSSPARQNKREPLNLRIRPEVRSLIDRAAQLAGKNRTEFILDAARIAAEEALCDQTHITLSARDYAAFVKLLDGPPRANKRLERAMRTKTPW